MSSDNRHGDAAGYNQRVLRKLERALARQPDLDLHSALPPQYQSKLASKKREVQASEEAESLPRTPSPLISAADSPPATSPPSPLPRIDISLPASVLYPLSAVVEAILSEKEPRWASENGYLSRAVCGILSSATILFQSVSDNDHFVARCSEHIVVKAISTADSTEYTTLKFLETKSQSLLAPAPAPHGVVAIGDVWYMFMSFVPGVSLDSVWQSLDQAQRQSLSCDLDTILLELHSIPFERGNALGGVAGQGCKDARRRIRTATVPIYTSEGLWDFMYGCARNQDAVYGKFLRAQTFPPRNQRIAFIHGDFRPANIMVRILEDSRVQVTGLIDWEMSGFYPEDLECVKALNNLSPIGNDDWYLFLPNCIAPRDHLESWHADLVWDPYVV